MRIRVPGLLLALALLLAACGNGADDTPGDDAAAGDAGPIAIEMGDMYFEPDSIQVPAGETVELQLINEGGVPHDLVLEDGFESGLVDPGDTMTVEIGPFDSDTVGWCDVPGHRAAGMELEINVE